MKTILVFMAVGLLAACVVARGGGGGGERKEGEGERLGGFFSEFFWGWQKSCRCRNQCARNNGTKNIACENSRVEYLQCVDTTCSNQTCPDNQLFNRTSKTCEPCPAGFHVDAEKRRCVCDKGTTYDFAKQSCVDCPSGATLLPDRCFCNNTVYIRDKNACKPCPAGSYLKGKSCVCNSTMQFWSEAEFTCKDCPGTWVNYTVGSRRHPEVFQKCVCNGTKQIFDRESVSCVTCPEDSLVSKLIDNFCDCTNIGEVYCAKNNTCVAITSLFDGFFKNPFNPFNPQGDGDD